MIGGAEAGEFRESFVVDVFSVVAGDSFALEEVEGEGAEEWVEVVPFAVGEGVVGGAFLEAIEIEGHDVREYAINTVEFKKDQQGDVTALATVRVESQVVDGRPTFVPIDGSDQDFPAQMVLLAMGFTGPEWSPMLEGFGVDLTDRGNVGRTNDYATNVDGVFVCGDMGRGQSLIVWAIAEGRACAAAVDASLMGSSGLPVPVSPTDMPLR